MSQTLSHGFFDELLSSVSKGVGSPGLLRVFNKRGCDIARFLMRCDQVIVGRKSSRGLVREESRWS